MWSSAEFSHPGKVREVNEDCVLSRPEAGLFVVADGMGGHAAGDFASREVVRALARLGASGSIAERVDLVEDALRTVNEQLRTHGRLACDGMTVGCTVVTLLADEAVAVALWAGDCRLYRYRDARLEQVTRDHNPVCDLLDVGAITEQEALAVDTNVVTRAIGGQAELHLDIAVFDVRPDDTFLLCSDGLYRELSNDTMAKYLALESGEAASGLMDRCLASPARDNVSLIVARGEALNNHLAAQGVPA